MAAVELSDRQRRSGAYGWRNRRCKAAPIRETRAQQRVVCIELLAQAVGDDFEARAQPAGVVGNGGFLAQSSIGLAEPRGIWTAHDFADAFVQQQRFNRLRNGRINSKLIARTFQRWKPSGELSFRE